MANKFLKYTQPVETEGPQISMGNPFEKYVLPPEPSPQEPEKTSRLGAFGRGMQEMTSLSLTDELRGFGRAVGSKVRGDERPFPELLDTGINEVRNEYTKAKEDRPGYTLAGEISGAILPAFTPGGQALAARMGAGGLGARVAKGSASGAASLGAYGFGSGEGDVVDRLPRAAKFAAGGAALGGAVPVAVAGLGKLNTKYVVPNSDKIKEVASGFYKKAEEAGGAYKAEFTDQFLNRARQEILSDDELINAMKSNKPLADAFSDLDMFRGQPMTLTRAQALDEQFGNMIDGFVDANGNMMKAGNKLLKAQKTFRDMIENADDSLLEGSREGFTALKEGRKLWATSRRLADIERILENASTYQVPATAIKTGFRRLSNSSKILGYTPVEAKAIKKAAQTGIHTDVLATFGNRLAPLVGMAGGVKGAALGYGTATASRGLATASQMSRANKAAKLVAERSGMVTKEARLQIPKSLKDILKLPPNEAKKLLAIHNNR
jgi:hypothetical protein